MQLRQIRFTPADQAFAVFTQVEQRIMTITREQMSAVMMAIALVTVIGWRIIAGMRVKRLHNLHAITRHVSRMGMKRGNHVHQQQRHNHQYGRQGLTHDPKLSVNTQFSMIGFVFFYSRPVTYSLKSAAIADLFPFGNICLLFAIIRVNITER